MKEKSSTDKSSLYTAQTQLRSWNVQNPRLTQANRIVVLKVFRHIFSVLTSGVHYSTSSLHTVSQSWKPVN